MLMINCQAEFAAHHFVERAGDASLRVACPERSDRRLDTRHVEEFFWRGSGLGHPIGEQDEPISGTEDRIGLAHRGDVGKPERRSRHLHNSTVPFFRTTSGGRSSAFAYTILRSVMSTMP